MPESTVVFQPGANARRLISLISRHALASSMKARCLSIVSSVIPFLYPSVGQRPSPCGCLRKWRRLPYPVTSRKTAQDANERAFPRNSDDLFLFYQQ